MTIPRGELEKRVKRLNALPTLSSMVKRVCNMLEDPTTSAYDLGNVISSDPAISAKILKLINSTYYGLAGRVGSINHALVLLGFKIIRGLMLSTTVFDMMIAEGMLYLWKHSVGCSAFSGLIAREIGHDAPEEVSVAGLLHDLGKVVIAVEFRDEYKKIESLIQQEKMFQVDAEKEVLGITHGDVALWLCDEWKLPKNLIEPIAYHHNPELAEHAPIQTAIVHLSNILIRARGFGMCIDPWVPSINPKAWRDLNLSFGRLEDILIKAEDKLLEVEDININTEMGSA